MMVNAIKPSSIAR